MSNTKSMALPFFGLSVYRDPAGAVITAPAATAASAQEGRLQHQHGKTQFPSVHARTRMWLETSGAHHQAARGGATIRVGGKWEPGHVPQALPRRRPP